MSVAKKNTTENEATGTTAAKSRANGTAKATKTGRGNKPASPRPDEMTSEVIEFIQAIDHYKRLQQRPFPTWSEVLEVLKSLGYSKAS